MMNDYLKWTATAVCLFGAFCTSFRIDPINIYLLNIGAFLFLVWSVRIKDTALIVVNLGLLIAYLIGLFI
jgi:4-hydroxybenzoate polyprenyltransferase